MNQLEQLHQWSLGIELADPSQVPSMAMLRNHLQTPTHQPSEE